MMQDPTIRAEIRSCLEDARDAANEAIQLLDGEANPATLALPPGPTVRALPQSHLRVYIAAPFEDAARVRSLHRLLRAAFGITGVSQWAEKAEERAAVGTPSQFRAIRRENITDLESADLVLALIRHGAGREMFAEIGHALAKTIPLIWCGPPIGLSAFEQGVTIVDDIDQAIAIVRERAQ